MFPYAIIEIGTKSPEEADDTKLPLFSPHCSIVTTLPETSMVVVDIKWFGIGLPDNEHTTLSNVTSEFPNIKSVSNVIDASVG